MGSLCSTSSDKDNDPFSKPGRTLGSAPQPSSGTAAIPARGGAKAASTAQSAGRTSGGGTSADGGAGNARSSAAKAAEERLKSASHAKGKLGEQLAAQKKQTRTDTLEEASRQNRAQRDADISAEARSYN